jgi:hypothetical protein
MLLTGCILFLPHSLAQRTQTDNVSSLPIAELAVSNSATNDPQRARRNQKYDAAGDNSPFSEKSPEESIFVSDNSISEEPAFPVSQSDLIMVGHVQSSAAYISNDGKAVYSEYTTSLLKLIKGSGVAENSSVVIERLGGRIKLPSGKILTRCGINGKNHPKQNSTYIFFLKQNPEIESYDLTTAYELKGDLVYPLDHSSNPEEPIASLQNYDRYIGATKLQFWEALGKEIRIKGTRTPVTPK